LVLRDRECTGSATPQQRGGRGWRALLEPPRAGIFGSPRDKLMLQGGRRMAIKESLLPELDQEAAVTRRLLERLPAEKLGWQPHPKSMTLSRLVTHLTELANWGIMAITEDEIDINPPGGGAPRRTELRSVPEILSTFDANVAHLRKAVADTSDATFQRPWTLKSSGQVIFTLPKIAVLRAMVLSHLIHHRGQLTVYLRLLDVPIPSIYGPTADEGWQG
jgi:uncharacterized damage-inducible protein DinB